MAAPSIHTYHCLCTALVLASTHKLSSLPRRADPSLDKAIILPLPPLPSATALPQSPATGQEDDAMQGTSEIPESSTSAASPKNDALPPVGYTILLSLTPDRKATIVRREDGFEKRYLYRCGRCRLVVGYELDEAHYSPSQNADIMDVDAKHGAAARTKIIYILPGGLMDTDVMASGKKITEGQVVFEQSRTMVAAWE